MTIADVDISSDVATLSSRIKAWLEVGQYAEAETYLRRFIAQHGQQKPLLVLLVQLLKQQEKWPQLIEAGSALLVLDPHYDEMGFMLDYALALQFEGEFKRSLIWHLKLLQRLGDKPEKEERRAHMADMFYNVGVAYDMLGEFEKARRFYEMARDREPAHGRASFALATLQIKCSNLTAGFDEYNTRFMLEDQPRSEGYNCPVWQGESLEGKHLVVWSEQGIGDVVMFAGFVPYLLAHTASLTLEVAPYMVQIISRSFPGATVLAKEANQPSAQVMAGSYDYVCPMGDMLHLLERYKPCAVRGYLKPDAKRVAELRGRYAKPGKKLVGISWRTINPDSRVRRNIPLALWGPILRTPDVQFVSLQYSGEQEELEHARQHLGVDILQDDSIKPMENREDFFAQVAAMDAVVSIQNSTVHAGGAMGIDTLIMVPVFGDFRWGVSGDSNVWYESVAIARQKEYGDWQPVIEQAAEWVKRLAVSD